MEEHGRVCDALQPRGGRLMPRRAWAGVSFETPERWSDRSMLIVVAPHGDGAMAPNVVVAREERRLGERIDEHAQRQLQRVAAIHPDLTLLDSGPNEVAGRPAFFVRYTAKTPAGLVEQTIVYVDVPDAKWLTTVTATGPSDAAWRAEFTRMLLGARVDVPTAPEARSLRTPLAPPPPRPSVPEGPAIPMPWIPMPGERSAPRR
jgi:hypothetical protein